MEPWKPGVSVILTEDAYPWRQSNKRFASGIANTILRRLLRDGDFKILGNTDVQYYKVKPRCSVDHNLFPKYVPAMSEFEGKILPVKGIVPCDSLDLIILEGSSFKWRMEWLEPVTTVEECLTEELLEECALSYEQYRLEIPN